MSELNDVLEQTPVNEIEFAEQKTASVNNTSVGQRLASARTAVNLELPHVAEHLKISVSQIAAIEKDAFHLLPSNVIARGFVKSYAKMLKLDADELLSMMPKTENVTQLESSLAIRPSLSAPFVDSRLTLSSANEKNSLYIWGVLLIVLGVALFLANQHFQLIDKIQKMRMSDDSASVTINATSINTVASLPTEIRVASSNVIASNENSKSTVQSIASASTQLNPNSLTEVLPHAVTSNNNGEISTTNVDANSLNKSSENIASQLLIKYVQDSWIEVKTESGQILSSHLGKAGFEENFDLNQALKIKIGNVAGVQVWVRGKPLVVDAGKNRNVANIVVK